MRRTFPGAAALLTALSSATVVGLLLSACTVTEDGSPSDPSAGASDTGVDPATLNLAVGDCVADLGAQEEAEPSDSAGSSTAATTTSSSASRTSGAAKSSATTTASTVAGSESWVDLDGDGYADEPTEAMSGGDAGATETAEVSTEAQLDDTVPPTATGVTKIDCGEPHVGEVYAQQELDNQVLFPGSRMPQFTSAVCTGDAFTDYIGYSFAYSVFDVITYAPSKESWAAGDRTVTCIVTDPATGYIEGTLQDAGY